MSPEKGRGLFDLDKQFSNGERSIRARMVAWDKLTVLLR